ncbi:RING finger protein [Endozoicomonas sp. 8E]|uniref:RING finger protein n=1 Tax=Endozoicomonas sp. 8E TaxID=3035692 RepID=UPI002939057E|nr:RING finger protein [Endozoicomonas sp. 8E]WOG29220.1 RING finger protein [Endozoicomonas sp. 8E]
MIRLCSLRTLFFSVLLFFSHQGLANDSYDLERFREYQKTNWKPPSKKKQRQSGQPVMGPLENIRIGFVRLNLESDDLFGDVRLKICENYEVSEEDFQRLLNFFFNYVNIGDPHYQKARILTALRLIHRMFDININAFMEQSPTEKELINTMAKSLFTQMFLSDNVNGRRNPYFLYFHSVPSEDQSYYHNGVNNGLVLMFLAFLGPHYLSRYGLSEWFSVLQRRYTRKSYDRAFSRELLAGDVNEYNSPQSIANQLTAAALDTETALLIGLTAMAPAASRCLDSGQRWPETLETLLMSHMPDELLVIIYNNLASLCHNGRIFPVPTVMCTLSGRQDFTHSILAINPEPAISSASSSESLDYQSDYSLGSDNEVEDSGEALDSGHQDQSIVIQQQNELIAQLRQEIANQHRAEEAGAVGGAPEKVIECPVCFEPLQEITLLETCGHAGLCKACAERFVREQRGCPVCRKEPESFRKIFLMPPH